MTSPQRSVLAPLATGHPSGSSTAAQVEWSQQDARLWTGRSGGRPIGTIERGRRFTFVDVDGVRVAGCASLAAAQDAAGLTSSDLHAPRDSAGGRIVRAFASGVAASTVTVLVAAAVLVR